MSTQQICALEQGGLYIQGHSLGFTLTLSFPLDSAEVFCRGSLEIVKDTECISCDLV